MGEVVEDRALKVDVRIGGRVGLAETLADRHDVRLVDGAGRPLRRRVVAAQRFDRVADELDTDRLIVTGRVDVNNSAAYAELAMLVDGILSRVAGYDEPLGKKLWADFDAGPQVDSGPRQLLRRHQSRKKSGRRRDDHPRLAGGQRRKRGGAG